VQVDPAQSCVFVLIIGFRVEAKVVQVVTQQLSSPPGNSSFGVHVPHCNAGDFQPGKDFCQNSAALRQIVGSPEARFLVSLFDAFLQQPVQNRSLPVLVGHFRSSHPV
jgi:hypothetical protein